jgi:DNA (cytosine-5)-methyltransferase 1
MNVLDLFSGIGGFSLGLERAGMRTVAFCEIEPFQRAVLRKHWPETPIYEDIRTLSAQHLTARRIAVDVICGGFPCQDISFAGKGEGITETSRSGLWSEYARLVSEIRPRFVIVENVTALLGRGLSRVLGDLAALGYDAEWHCIPAAAVGAPHLRDRVWVIAHTDKVGCGFSEQLARGIQAQRQSLVWEPFRATNFRVRVQELAAVCGDDDGVPEELGAYGNSVIPQIPEIIGRAIMNAQLR